MNDQGGFHLGAGVLDGIGQPAQAPEVELFGAAVTGAHVAQQIEQVFAAARLGHGGPSHPQVAVDIRVALARVKPDLGDANDLLFRVFCPGAVDLAAHADVAHVAQRHEHVLFMVKHGATLAIDEGEALQ